MSSPIKKLRLSRDTVRTLHVSTHVRTGDSGVETKGACVTAMSCPTLSSNRSANGGGGASDNQIV